VKEFVLGVTELVVDGGYEPTDFSKSAKYSDKNNSHKCRPYAEPVKGFPCGVNNPAYTNGSFTEFQTSKSALQSINYCQRCGIVGAPLEHHHIDGDRSNSSMDNVEKLCNSCHKKADYEIGKRKKRWTKGHKTATATVIDIRQCEGWEDVYDIEMDTAEHNWLANGIVTSNSHSMSYAILGYTMCWYKIHFPTEFYKVMLQMSVNEQNTHEEIAKLYYDALMNGVEVLPPDLSKANADFEIYDGKIYYGFQHIKSLGKKSMRQVREFKKIKTYDQALRAICDGKIKPGVTIALSRCGALDYLIDPSHNDRITLTKELELFFALTDKRQDRVLELMDELDNGEEDWAHQKCPGGNRLVQAVHEWYYKNKEKLRNEKLLANINGVIHRADDSLQHIVSMAQDERHFLGIYINFSEADAYASTTTSQPLCNILRQAQPRASYEALVCVEGARKIVSKKNNKLVLADVLDTTGKATAMLCGDAYSQYKDLMLQHPVLQIVTQVWGGTLMIESCKNPPKKEK
jgi:hypothetical protein